MRLGRAIGVVLLSVVDAFVPAAVVALITFSLTRWAIPGVENRLEVVAVAAGVTFLVTIAVGLASAAFRDRPFPATRTARRVVDWWTLYGWP